MSPIYAEGKTLVDKLLWLERSAESKCEYIIEIGTDDCIEKHVFRYLNKTNIVVTLRGIGATRTISLNTHFQGSLFEIHAGVTLVLENNITLQGHSNNDNSLIYVNGGEFVMQPGSAIVNNWNITENISTAAMHFGGGVKVLFDGGFTMNGGLISDNFSAGGGGGVAVAGNGHFIMNGGTISNNTSGRFGGGIHIEGTFKMNEGRIEGNIALDGIGGGVYVLTGHFYLMGGIISRNISQSAKNSFGGGVAIHHDERCGNVVFSKQGGTIIGYETNGQYNNVVKNGSKAVTGWGHSICCTKNLIPVVYRDYTVDATSHLSFEGKSGYHTGNWQDFSFPTSSCYIATCVYGSYDAPEVQILRSYRDDVLYDSCLGRCFIRTYYSISPKLVKYCGAKRWFHKLWKPILDKIVAWIQKPNKKHRI